MLFYILMAVLATLVIAAAIYYYTDYKTNQQSQIWQKQAVIQNFTH